MDTQRKVCAACKEEKSSEYFSPDRRGSFGLCAYCKPCNSLRSRRYRKANPETSNKINRNYRAKLKQKMLEAYGRKCTCCGEDRVQFLTLEHINHDGQAHREEFNGGIAPLLDLQRRGWPKDGYTLLCWNCNMATRHGDKCPHQEVRELEKTWALSPSI